MLTAILNGGPLDGQSMRLVETEPLPLWLDLPFDSRTVRYLLSPESVTFERVATKPTTFAYEYYPADEIEKLDMPRLPKINP